MRLLLERHGDKGNDKCWMAKDKGTCEDSCAWLMFTGNNRPSTVHHFVLTLLFFVSVSDWKALLNGREH